MSIRDQFQTELKQALKAKDNLAAGTIRLILAALKDRDIAARAKGEEIDENEIMAMLQSMIKQRHESTALYEQGGRDDLVKQEQAEIEIITKFLPKQMTEDEIKEAVSAVIEALNPEGLKDMGKMMTHLREQYVGRMDFKLASALVKQSLS